MNGKRISLVVTLSVMFLITACGLVLPAEIISMEEPTSPIEDSPPVVDEVDDEKVPALVPDSSLTTGLQTVITRENAGDLVQVEYIGKGNINNMAWSPLGSPIALATATGIYLIDPQTNEEVHFSTTLLNHIAFSPEGKVLASAEGPLVILRDVEAGNELDVLAGHAESVYQIAFSPIENLLATASQDETIKLWDLDSGDELQTFKGPRTFVHDLAFSPDGKTLVSAANSVGSDITLLVIESGEEIDTDSDISGTTLAVSPDGEMVAAGGSGYNESLKLFDFNGQVLFTLDEVSKPISALSFSPDGKYLASSSLENPDDYFGNTTLKLWDTASGNELITIDSDKYFIDLAFSPDGTQLASTTIDEAKLWDVESGQEIGTLTDQSDTKGGYGTGGVDDFAWSPDGSTLALATGCGVNLVNLQTQAETQLCSHGYQPQIGHIISFSPDGDLLAFSCFEYGGVGRVEIWDLKSNELVLTLDDFEEMTVFSIAFSPDGATLATGWGGAWGMGPGSVKIWDISTGVVIHDLGYNNHETIYNLAFNPEGDLLAAISGIGQVHIWNIPEETEVLTFFGTSGYGFAVAFSPDGKRIAAGGGASDGRFYDYDEAELGLFDVTTGELIYQLEGHQAIIRSIAFSVGGDVLASGSWDGTVRLWDVETGQQLAVLDIPGATSVGFSPDGTLLATVGFQDVLRLWGTHETAASFPENLAGETSTIPVLVQGEDFRRGAWSPDGRYYFYTQQGPMDEPGPDQAMNTLTFLQSSARFPHTDLIC